MIRRAAVALVCGAWAGHAWAQAAAPITSSSWWTVVVMGIPLSVLAAALAGASARSLKEGAGTDQGLPKRATGTIVDGFVGGWFAVVLIGFTTTAPYLEKVPAEAVGAMGGLLTEYIRVNGGKWWDELRVALLSRIRRKSEDSP